MLLLSDKLMICCAVGTNGCLDLRRRAVAILQGAWAGHGPLRFLVGPLFDPSFFLNFPLISFIDTCSR